MNYNEVLNLQENNKMVQHKDSPNISGYVSCFDNEKTGVYLKPSYTFVQLKDLQPFNIHNYYNSI